MQHLIKAEELGEWGLPMMEAIEACVHCGFCLPACPTYETLQEEMDSPRGRIFLMKEVLEGGVALEEASPYLDRCLGCVGCVPACPSGVAYGELITSFRAHTGPQRRRSPVTRLVRSLMLFTLPSPGRFRLAARAGRLAMPLRRLLPGRLRVMLDLLPDALPARTRLPELVPAEGPRRGRVALLAGCAQQVLAPQINEATLRVLTRNGIEVLVPRRQRCCGALAAHTGDMRRAQAAARHNLNAFPDDVDAILTNAAGCGSGMREYGLWMRGLPEAEEATRFAGRVRDVSEYLDELGIIPPAPLTRPLRLAYHDACHLAHAQGVRQPPRNLLQSIPGVELVEIPRGDLCCGSAGTYNLEQPEIAAELGRAKTQAILATGADAVATGNIGCMTQIAFHLRQHREDGGQPVPAEPTVLHTMEVLDRAYRGIDSHGSQKA